MTHALPIFVAALSAIALLVALYALFRSLRAALSGESDALAVESLVSPARATLLDEKDALLAGLRDLASDHEAGKTSDEDRAHSEGRMRARAKAVLRALEEEVAPHRAAAEAMLGLPATLDVGAKPVETAKPIETAKPVEAATPIEVAKPATERACAACATKNDEDAAFCKKCGKPLEAEDAR